MPSLTQMIEAQVRFCTKHRGYKKRQLVSLGRGLLLDIYVGTDGEYHLQLRRAAPTWPSEGEVATVLRAWPKLIRPATAPEAKRRTWLDPTQRREFNCISMAWSVARPEMGGQV